MNKVKSTTIEFDLKISSKEVPMMRGAIIKLATSTIKDNADLIVLFHNHLTDTTFRYSYPLIQYKQINGNGAIVCIADGNYAFNSLIATHNKQIKIGNRKTEPLSIIYIQTETTDITILDFFVGYKLSNWISLNSANYDQYINIDSLSEKVCFLERILIGNILSFCKGLDITLDNHIVAKITNLSEPKLITVKKTCIYSFDIEFKSNVALPNNIGLGKNVSLGYGLLTRL